MWYKISPFVASKQLQVVMEGNKIAAQGTYESLLPLYSSLISHAAPTASSYKSCGPAIAASPMVSSPAPSEVIRRTTEERKASISNVIKIKITPASSCKYSFFRIFRPRRRMLLLSWYNKSLYLLGYLMIQFGYRMAVI